MGLVTVNIDGVILGFTVAQRMLPAIHCQYCVIEVTQHIHQYYHT